ncbi:MAG: signal peptidase II [Alphaproteobacteria bacterium]|nr:MAG: signal peptidase II [Alphaproteobacteria bacterium]
MRLTILAALAVFALDQWTKIAVVHWMNLRHLGTIEVLPPWITFRMAWNYGVNFGLFADHSPATRWVLVALALAVSAWVLWWVRHDQGRAVRLFAGMLVGGALGNVVDRILYGAVADFLNVTCCGIDNPFAFNVADIAIFLGAAGLVLTHRSQTSGQKSR